MDNIYEQYPTVRNETADHLSVLMEHRNSKNKEIEGAHVAPALTLLLSKAQISVRALITTPNLVAIKPLLEEKIHSVPNAHILAFSRAREWLQDVEPQHAFHFPTTDGGTLENMFIIDNSAYTWNPGQAYKDSKLYVADNCIVPLLRRRFDNFWKGYTQEDLDPKKPQQSFYEKITNLFT